MPQQEQEATPEYIEKYGCTSVHAQLAQLHAEGILAYRRAVLSLVQKSMKLKQNQMFFQLELAQA